MGVEEIKPVEWFVVKLTNNYFKHRDILNCCQNKKLTEGTWEQIKRNAENEWEQQIRKQKT